MNACLYYCWLLAIFKNHSASIKYTKGHANNDTLPTVLNIAADQYAVNAQSDINTLYAPIPSFFIDNYTLYNSTNGWIKSNTRYYVEHRLALNTAHELEYSTGLRLQCLIYDLESPPKFPYL